MSDNQDDMVTMHHADENASLGVGERIAPGVWKVPSANLMGVFAHGWLMGPGRRLPDVSEKSDERDIAIERMGKDLAEQKVQTQSLMDRLAAIELGKEEMAAADEKAETEIKKLDTKIINAGQQMSSMTAGPTKPSADPGKKR